MTELTSDIGPTPRYTAQKPLPREVAELMRVNWSEVKTARLPLGPPIEQSPSGIGISVVVWCNKPKVLNDFLTPSFMHQHQLACPDIDLILIGPAAKCRNMGEAYNLGQSMARHETIAYLHQDVRIYDRTWADKVDVMLSSGIGGLGFVGSLVDTGGPYFFASPWDQVTVPPDLRVTPVLTSDASPVAMVDGMGIVTRTLMPWATCYEQTHLFVEDYCMRLRAAGLSIWTVGSNYIHGSGGTVDASFWRSLQTFRRKWKKYLPDDIIPVERYRRFYNEMVSNGKFTGLTAFRGGWELAALPEDEWWIAEAAAPAN